MRRSRVAQTWPVGSTYYRGENWLLTKTNENHWDDGDGQIYIDRDIDRMQDNGDGELVINNLGLEFQAIPSYDLEAGDYVVMTWGFWESPDDPLFDPDRSQTLFRVAGWLTNEPDRDGDWKLLLDASESVLRMIDRAKWPGEGGDPEPITLYVDADDVFQYVEKVPQHLKDDGWDWTYDYTFVEPPEDPTA